MLLQTFVQLNILLLAAPALAGWVLSPVAHPLLVQSAQVVLQPIVREAEATPEAVEERLAPQQASKRPAVLRSAAILTTTTETSVRPAAPTVADPAATRLNPFPHATRAP